jgi:hypothetical protein
VDTVTGAKVNVTNNGAAYVGSFVPNTDLLWISIAGGPGDPGGPNSFLVDLTPTDAGVGRVDLAQVEPVEGVFQPTLNPAGDRVIFWRGVQGGDARNRYFESGGTLLVEEAVAGEFSWEGRPLFEYVLIGDDGVINPDRFSSASLSWAGDGDTFAVWQVTTQGGSFPEPNLLYVGTASTGQALNRNSFSYGERFAGVAGTQIVDVEFTTDQSGAPNALLVTVQLDAGAEGPGRIATSTLIRVDLADGTEEELAPSDGAWQGPAVWVAPQDSQG